MKFKTDQTNDVQSRKRTPSRGKKSFEAWEGSGKAVTIDEFIEDQSRQVDSVDLCLVSAFSSRLREKAKNKNADRYPNFRAGIQVLVQVLELPVVKAARDPLPRWLAELVFAANYLLKSFDLIPDHLPEIGLADDARILQRVIERNQCDLHRHLAACIEAATDGKAD
jgi:uncharacterized membrane protein YkvA (DUF1232 family)